MIIENGSAPFSRTKFIKIVPRYILLNNLHEAIIFKQKNHTRQYVLEPQAKQIYNFEDKNDKDCFLMVRQKDDDESNTTIPNHPAGNENMWSSPFSIEDIEDFQISFPSPDQRMSASTAFVKWYLPSSTNYHQRFIRVSINTQDDATIFIIFNNPKFPEYLIYNNTDLPIKYSQFKATQ